MGFYSNGSQIDSSLDATHTYPNVTFIVTLQAFNECGFDTTSETINILSTFEENIIDNLKIYPNPFSQNVKINHCSIFKEFELYNTQSKLVLKQDLNKDLTDLNLSLLPRYLFPQINWFAKKLHNKTDKKQHENYINLNIIFLLQNKYFLPINLDENRTRCKKNAKSLLQFKYGKCRFK